MIHGITYANDIIDRLLEWEVDLIFLAQPNTQAPKHPI